MNIDIIRSVVGELSRHWEAINDRRQYSVSGRTIANKHSRDLQLSDMFRIIGAGNFSVVLSSINMPDLVVKFSPREDDAYFHYALWCRANPHPHAPEILHIEKIPQGYFVVMPRYDTHHEDWQDRLTTRAWAEEIACNPRSDSMRNMCVAKYPPSLGEFARNLGLYFENICALDMHEENVMWSNGRMIITDPVSYNDRRNTREEQHRRAHLERQCCYQQQGQTYIPAQPSWKKGADVFQEAA